MLQKEAFSCRVLPTFCQYCAEFRRDGIPGQDRNRINAPTPRAVERVAPDVVIMDTRMPVMDGAEATRRVKERFPDVRVVAFTSTGDRAAVTPMLAAGASGYLLNGASSEQITAVLESLDG
jgi:DNA-binding NarL/FixJ family response regulator